MKTKLTAMLSEGRSLGPAPFHSATFRLAQVHFTQPGRRRFAGWRRLLIAVVGSLGVVSLGLRAQETTILNFNTAPLGIFTSLEQEPYVLTWIGFGDYQRVAESGGPNDRVLKDNLINASGAEVIIRRLDGGPFRFEALDAAGTAVSPDAIQIALGAQIQTILPASPNFVTYPSVAPDLVITSLRVNIVSVYADLAVDNIRLSTPPLPPVAVTAAASPIDLTSVTLNGTVHPGSLPTTAWFEWGLTTNYGTVTPATSPGSGPAAVTVRAPVSALVANTLYHCRLVASNSLGMADGEDRTFGNWPIAGWSDGNSNSLRQAIANASPGAILYLTNSGPIALTGGELMINKDLCLVGTGATKLDITAQNSNRIFNIAANVEVQLYGLMIRDGRAPNGANGATASAAGQPGANGGGIYNAGTLTLGECIVTNCRAGDGGNGYLGSTGAAGGAGGHGGEGGGIWNANTATLILRTTTIAGNSAGAGGNGANGGHGINGTISHSAGDGGDGGAGGAGGRGGGVFGAGSVTVELCTAAANFAGVGGAGGTGGEGGGGGTWRYDQDGGDGGRGGDGGSGGSFFEGGLLFVSNSTLSGNTAAAGGNGGNGGHDGTGGLGTGSAGSAAAGGAGGYGGGICSTSHAELYNCTAVYNAAGPGGVGGTWPSVIVGTQNGQGGGVASVATTPVRLANTIIALNTASGLSAALDAHGTFTSRGCNLIGDVTGSAGFSSGTGDLLNTYPLLTPLAANGGSTWTHALWPESPAINAGSNAWATTATDQVGNVRITCTNVDIGAFEYGGCPLPLHPAAQRALYLDGVNDYVDGGAVTLSNFPFTIEAWAKRDTVGSGDIIISQGLPSADFGLRFGFLPGNQFTFDFYRDNFATTNAYTDSAWHHWAGTYDTNGQVLLLYCDGNLITSNTTLANYRGSGPLRIGSLAWGGWLFDGEIDEVRVWNVVRTGEEIRQNYQRALTGTEPGLVAYYRFDEAIGTKTRDSVTGFEATLVNGPARVLSSTPLYLPIVATVPADAVRSTTATLLGSVNPAGPYLTTCWFEYGPSLYFGSSTDFQYLDPGLVAQPLAFAITNLESGTKYYFRLVADNAAGRVYGETLAFDTLVVGNGYPIATRANNGQSTTSPRHITDAEGNLYLAGLFSGGVTFKQTLQATGSLTNAFLAKLARKGDWRWAVNVPVTSDGLVKINALALDGTNVLVAGTFSGTVTFGGTNLTASSGSQAFVARYEPAATNWAWAIAFGNGASNSATALKVGGNGNVYVAGQFSGETSFGTNQALATDFTLTAQGGSDAFVACFNAAGQPEWVTQAGGTGTGNHDSATALVLGLFGDLHVAGFFMDEGVFGMRSISSTGGSDAFLATLNQTNGLIQRVIRTGGPGADQGTAVAADAGGNVYLVAQLYGTADFDGAPLPELDAAGANLLVAQINRQGVLSRRAASRAAFSDSIEVSPSGRVYLAGDFTGIMRYGPTLITVGSGPNGSSDVFLAQLVEGTDALTWTDFKQIGGIGNESRGNVSVDPTGSVVVSGTFSQSLHLGYVEISTPNPQEIFLARLDSAGVYEHNLWEIGKTLIPPDEALLPPYEVNRAKGIPRIEILETPKGLEDSSDMNSFCWNDSEKRLYPIRPITARIKWSLTQDPTNLANVATIVGRCVWPDHPQTNVAGVPVEVQGPGLGRGYSFIEVAFNTNGANVLPVTRDTQQFQVFQTSTNASGYNVLRYADPDNKSAFDVVFTRPYGSWATNDTRPAGTPLTRGGHQDSLGRNGYVFFERSFYDANAHDRATRVGPILPVNRNLHNDPNRDLVVVWYRTNELTGVAWGCDPVRYTIVWPADAEALVIASGTGVSANSTFYPQAQVYDQPDPNLAGFNPNEEHALIIADRLYALRCDLNSLIIPKPSDPYVLLKYLGPDSTNDWRMKVCHVVAEDESHTFAHFGSGLAGLEVQLPAPLSLLPLCGSSNRIAFGQAQAHQAWTGKIYAKSAGYLQLQYWYPSQPGFYFGATNPAVGTCIPWMNQYAQATVTPGATRPIGEPVLVGYDVEWPTEVAMLHYAETLTGSKSGGLPDLLHFNTARVIYDEGNPLGTNQADALVRVFDPLSERTIQLDSLFKLPDTIAKASDRGRIVFPDLPYPLRIRLFYDELNQRLSFSGWYDPDFGTGEPLLLPNILTPRERDRIQQLDGTNTVSEFDRQLDRLYDLTRNPNQVDVDRDGTPDKQLRVGLITQIRDGFTEILIGPVITGPSSNFVTFTTNTVLQPVSLRVTNVIQEQFGSLPKALTAGLRPESGYVTIIENDDRTLPGQPISLHIIYVTNSLFRGDLKVLPSDNVFDERLTLRHSGDFGGEPQKYEFEWYYQPDQNGSSPPFPVTATDQTNWNGWIRFPTSPSGTNNGFNDVTLGEGNTLSSLLVLSDNWLLCRYRGFTSNSVTAWSDWVGAPGGEGAMLAQGWIKRVIAGLNEFDSRTKDFHESPAATYASMILQAGERYEGPIAFNPDPDYLNQLGLIESYETVLDRARKLSIDGLPAVNFGPANNALLRAAGKIADLYMLLGNEAYADASDPTIGFTTSSGEYGNLAPSIFCFQNQLDSPLEEELALLRGRDDSGMSVRARPIYNRLLWNFTLGEGEVAYKLTYNISDQDGDGFIDERDARTLYPQGHGDAWGHYLTATKKYYALLRHPYYEWVPRPEAVTVAGSPVQVDYLDERKFAQAAAAKAKTGAEIVNLSYRQKYVADPAGQWQGYKDTQPDRAWGVSEWAARAGGGAYFDWVTANAILPATDPDTNHVGIQKIDRTTVTELTEIPAQFAAIEAQLDSVDQGLNPLGLAVGAMPFDIDPSKVASGETHFDQIYERALKAMENTLALFDHVNALSQNLRRNQDEVDEFSTNVEDQERDYKNRMIEIFGYPYTGDIGPSGTYPSGYDGPDIYHYMYVNASELTGDKSQPEKLITGYYKPLEFPGFSTVSVSKWWFFPDDIETVTQPVLDGNGRFQVTYPMVEQGVYEFTAPAAWGNRRAPGKLQNALAEMLKARAKLNQGLIEYDNLRRQTQDEVELLKAQADLASFNVITRGRETATILGINAITLLQTQVKEQMAAAETKAKEAAKAVAAGIPTSVTAFGGDVMAPARASILTAGNILSWGATVLKVAAIGGEKEAENAKLILESQTALAIEAKTQKFEIAQRAKVIEQLCREEVAKRVELYSLQEDLQQSFGAYHSTLAEGQRLTEERYNFRVKTAAQMQEHRYQDMAFRIFQNDALQKYRAQFDLTARYVYLAAKAYDYETCLLNTETGAGAKLLTDIVRQRTLGQLVNGLPVSGRHGLADPLARLGQNFEVYRGQLGFTTPETETGRFSIRSELFRVRPGDRQTNELNGVVSTNQDWTAMLQKCRVPDLWKVPEFRRFCRPFAPESAGPQPGLVIRIPTTITFGLNYFGWPLGPGDSAYDSSRFATKVRSAGIWFSDYNLSGLSQTPRVYLVPAGVDVLRSPSSYTLETREFNVVDQKLPVPFPIGATDLGSPGWIPINDSLSETFGDIRRFSSFRAYHDQGWFNENEATQDTRLIGRSVWNTEWLLIIPGGTFLYDPDRGLDTFIATVGDIKIFFQTYSYSGN